MEAVAENIGLQISKALLIWLWDIRMTAIQILLQQQPNLNWYSKCPTTCAQLSRFLEYRQIYEDLLGANFWGDYVRPCARM